MVSEEHKHKAIGQFRLALNIILEPYMNYGYQESHELPSAKQEIVEAAILLAKRYSGEDVPITLDFIRSRAAKWRAGKHPTQK